MTGVLITVNGSAEEFHPPQRGTATVRIGFEGPAKEPVRQRTVELAGTFTADVQNLLNPQAGPVTWYSQEAVSTWSEKPWNKDGKQLPPGFHAQIALEVKFSDLVVLAGWVDHWASVEGVTLAVEIEWTLTEMSKREATARVKANAVRAARDKAQAYADSLELGPVAARQLADTGMLGQTPQGVVAVASNTGFSARGGPGGESAGPAAIAPQDVRVAAAVDAQFVTS